jgi:hypothetical protein
MLSTGNLQLTNMSILKICTKQKILGLSKGHQLIYKNTITVCYVSDSSDFSQLFGVL